MLLEGWEIVLVPRVCDRPNLSIHFLGKKDRMASGSGKQAATQQGRETLLVCRTELHRVPEPARLPLG